MYFYLTKKRNQDGSPLKNPTKIHCTVNYRFELRSQETIAIAVVNNQEIARLNNAQVCEINSIGIFFKGLEKINDSIFYQEWICGFDENFHDKLIDMETTQSHLFEGM